MINSRVFFHPNFQEYVLFGADVLSHFYQYAQRRFYQTEAGGEIFSKVLDRHCLIIQLAAGPYPKDNRTRSSLVPDAVATVRTRQSFYQKGFHSVGLWHTHPERVPKPSNIDQQTTREYLDTFEGDRQRFFQVIVGNHGDIPNLCLWSAGLGDEEAWVEWKEYFV